MGEEMTEVALMDGKYSTVKQLVPLYLHIREWIDKEEFGIIDWFFGRVDVSQLSNVLLIGLLRLTYRWKDELSS